MISLDKQYRTRDGREVRLYAVDGGGTLPVHGAVLCDGVYQPHQWRGDGAFLPYEDIQYPSDLIEVKKKHTVYLNTYRDGGSVSHPTKEAADSAAAARRTARVRVEFEEGQLDD